LLKSIKRDESVEEALNTISEINSRMCHFVASDAHRAGAYRKLLPEARRRVASLSGEETALALFEANPKAVLEGRTPKVPEPTAPVRANERRGLAGLFKRLKRQ